MITEPPGHLLELPLEHVNAIDHLRGVNDENSN